MATTSKADESVGGERSLRVGLAWDIGAGQGHAVRLVALASELASRGHRPVLLGRDLRTLRALAGERWPVLPAPHNSWFPESPTPAAWADILWIEAGLHDQQQALAIALGWRDLLKALQIDLLITDAAPLAPLAARALRIPTLAIGTGFLLPPAGPPWPAFRTWEPFDAQRIAERENAIAERIERVGQALGVEQSLSALQGDAQALFTHPPLDHYPERQRAAYVGPLHGSGQLPSWPGGERKVFVYLQAYYPHLHALLDALLARSDVSVLAYFGGAQPWTNGARLRVCTQPLDVTATLAACPLVITHGGNLAALAAGSGCPMLVLPIQAETYITAQRLVGLGVALAVTPPYDPIEFRAPLARLLDESEWRVRAGELATRLPQRSDGDVVAATLAMLLDASRAG